MHHPIEGGLSSSHRNLVGRCRYVVAMDLGDVIGENGHHVVVLGMIYAPGFFSTAQRVFASHS